MASDSNRPDPLSRVDRNRLEALAGADDLAELVELTDVESEHDAYLAAKREWATLRDRALPPARITSEELPGDYVDVDDTRFWVHGITHADTDAERAFLREHVARFLESGGSVYCEQGIRPMYFEDFDGVCAMDDYRWALAECERRGLDSHLPESSFSGMRESIAAIAGRFREATFSLIHGDSPPDEGVRMALGDVASEFLMSHEDVATGEDFEAFVRSRRAAENPALLGALQRYYETQFLPQPLGREWLRRPDPELELVSHARNERMADYAVFHAEAVGPVHLIVGAAHQPGVLYYLRQHRDGARSADDFEFVG
jgi:hypothetical protein